MIGRLLWSSRTISERTSLVLFAVGALWLAFVASQGGDPVDKGEEFVAYLVALLFMFAFLFFAAPLAAVMLFFGGAQFTAPWRRALDKLLPILVLVVLWLALRVLANSA